MLTRMADQLRTVTKSSVVVEPEIVDGDIVGGLVAVPKEDVQVALGWDPAAHYIAAHIEAPETHASSIVGMCNSLGVSMESGSILLPDQTIDVNLPELGYAKQFVFPLRKAVPTGVRYWLVGQKTERIRQEMEQLLGIAVTVKVASVDERPFIFTVDWEGARNGEPFACYLHFHSLSQAAYLEELTIPVSLRGRGFGAIVTDWLKELAAQMHCRYLYLWAKHNAERFWHREGFVLVYRANLRGERRRRRSLRRSPGWDRAWFEGEPLPHPQWYYRNHPQDDLDLFLGLTEWPVEGGEVMQWPDRS